MPKRKGTKNRKKIVRATMPRKRTLKTTRARTTQIAKKKSPTKIARPTKRLKKTPLRQRTQHQIWMNTRMSLLRKKWKTRVQKILSIARKAQVSMTKVPSRIARSSIARRSRISRYGPHKLSPVPKDV